MSPAAQARADAIARQQAEAEAAQQAAAEVAPVVIQPSLTPAPGTLAIYGRRITPAAAQKAFLIASSAGAVLAASGVALDLTGANDDRELETAAAQILLQLQEDQRRLKDIKSIERKIAAKALLLPNYEAWCQGVLANPAAPRGPLDDVFTTMLAWRIDVGDFIGAMPMIEFAVRNGMAMPDRFDRGVIDFAVEQISIAAIDAYDGPTPPAEPFPAAVLPQLEDLVEELDADLHDEIRAKLHRALGLAVLAGANVDDEEDLRERQAQALRCYTRAFELNPKVGVKKQIDALTKALKPAATPPADAAVAEPPAQDEAAAEQSAAQEDPADA